MVVDDRLGEDVLVLVELSGGWRVEHARGVVYAQGPSLMLLAESGGSFLVVRGAPVLMVENEAFLTLRDRSWVDSDRIGRLLVGGCW